MPARADTARFINRERLACLSERAWLINTARGAVVDEAALFELLAAGRLAGAALDVFAREPYVPAEGGGDLRSLANVILTPHVGSNTVESNRRMAERALQNIATGRGGPVRADGSAQPRRAEERITSPRPLTRSTTRVLVACLFLLTQIRMPDGGDFAYVIARGSPSCASD